MRLCVVYMGILFIENLLRGICVCGVVLVVVYAVIYYAPVLLSIVFTLSSPQEHSFLSGPLLLCVIRQFKESGQWSQFETMAQLCLFARVGVCSS